MTGRLQNDDRNAIPVAAIEASGWPVLQRNRPDHTRIELEMILQVIAHKNCACARCCEPLRCVGCIGISLDNKRALKDGCPVLTDRRVEQSPSRLGELLNAVGRELKQFVRAKPGAAVVRAREIMVLPVKVRGKPVQVEVAPRTEEPSKKKIVLECLCVVCHVSGSRVHI